MNYMKEHLLKAGANMELKERDELSRIPALKTWFRTSRAVVMHLTNGTLQVMIKAYLIPNWVILCNRYANFILFNERIITISDKLLQRSHKNYFMSSHGSSDVH